MKLKYYNLIIIVPIFFVLGIMLSSFNYYIQQKEIKSALYEEMNSISKAISIFLEDKKIDKDKEEIISSFNKIIRYKRVKRLLLIDKVDVVIKSISNDLKGKSFNYNKAKLLEIDKHHNMGIYNNLYRVGNTSLKLFVTLDASTEMDNIQQGVYQSIGLTFVMVLLGFIVSFILSYITNKNIHNLNIIANSIASGNYKNHDKNFMIKEVNDLSNTLDIVKSILKEILYKTKNSILDTDFSTKGDELIKPSIAVNELNSIDKNGIEVAVAVNANINQKEFYSCWDDEKYIYAFIGELNSTEDYLKDYITISSISKLVKHYISTNIFDMKKIKDMYPIRSMVSLKIDMQTFEIEENKIFEGNVTKKTYTLEAEIKSFHHDINIDERFKNYLDMYSYLSIKQIVSDINKIFDKESAVILVKRK